MKAALLDNQSREIRGSLSLAMVLRISCLRGSLSFQVFACGHAYHSLVFSYFRHSHATDVTELDTAGNTKMAHHSVIHSTAHSPLRSDKSYLARPTVECSCYVTFSTVVDLVHLAESGVILILQFPSSGWWPDALRDRLLAVGLVG